MLYSLLYNAFLKTYVLGVKAASFRNKKAAKWLEGRKNIFQKIENNISKIKPNAKRIWLHSASLGEFEQGRPLLEKIKQENPETSIILTFFSPSGYELRNNYELADAVFYLPMDGKENARKFIEIVKPGIAIFVRYEFWYYYFKLLNDNKIPLIMLSVVFREDQPFFKSYGVFHRKMLGFVTHFFVQNSASEDLLLEAGFKNVTQIPDTRIDRVWQVKQGVKPIEDVAEFLGGTKAFFGGSIYEKENGFIAEAYFSGIIQSNIIIAPHDIDNEHMTSLEKSWNGKSVRYSQWQKNKTSAEILIIDCIGLLNSLYQYASMAFIGGGFGKSIHNILEPAAFGIPVFFGPKHHKFKEARDLISLGGGFEINTQQDFNAVLKTLYSDENFYTKSCEASNNFIKNNTGGTEKVYKWMKQKMLLN